MPVWSWVGSGEAAVPWVVWPGHCCRQRGSFSGGCQWAFKRRGWLQGRQLLPLLPEINEVNPGDGGQNCSPPSGGWAAVLGLGALRLVSTKALCPEPSSQPVGPTARPLQSFRSPPSPPASAYAAVPCSCGSSSLLLKCECLMAGAQWGVCSFGPCPPVHEAQDLAGLGARLCGAGGSAPSCRAGRRGAAGSRGAWRPGGARLLPSPGGAFSRPYLTHAVCFKPLRLFLNLKI